MTHFTKRERAPVVNTAKFRVGGCANYTEISNIGDLTQAGAASAIFGDMTTACAVITAASFGTGATNTTIITSVGNIAQAGAASAALGDLTTACLKIGSGTDIQSILFGSFSPCFNAIAGSAADTGSGAITGLTAAHKLFVSPCTTIGAACLALISCCPSTGSATLCVVNAGGDTSGSSTCPWAYFAIK